MEFFLNSLNTMYQMNCSLKNILEKIIFSQYSNNKTRLNIEKKIYSNMMQ